MSNNQCLKNKNFIYNYYNFLINFINFDNIYMPVPPKFIPLINLH